MVNNCKYKRNIDVKKVIKMEILPICPEIHHIKGLVGNVSRELPYPDSKIKYMTFLANTQHQNIEV